MIKRVVYPGTFDPITNGHLDIIERAGKLVDRLVIAIGINSGKGPIFSVEERTAMVEEEAAKVAAGMVVEVRAFQGLLMDLARDVGAEIVIRGLRGVADFEYEYQMVGMNLQLNPDVETVFLSARPDHQMIASKLVKEIAMFGGDISTFVPPGVAEKTVARMKERT